MIDVRRGAGVGALLDERRRRAGIPQFVPADAGLVRGGVDGVIEDQRFVIAEIAVGDAVHEAVGNAVQPVVDGCVRRAVRVGRGRHRLRNAWPRAHAEGSTGDDSDRKESRA